MTDVALFAVYTVSSVLGLLLLKHALPLVRIEWEAGLVLSAPIFLLGLGACIYIASFAVWLAILARHELSVAYPTAIGLTLAFSTVGAAVSLGESLSLPRAGGIVLIFLGIILVTRY